MQEQGTAAMVENITVLQFPQHFDSSKQSNITAKDQYELHEQ